MNNNDVEKQADDLLAALGRELARSRTDYADAVLDENVPNPPFYQKERIKKNGRKMLRKALVLVAVLTMIMGLAVVSSEGLREGMFNYFLEEKPGHTDLKSLENGENDGQAPNFQLGYVPEGYEKEYEEEHEKEGYIIDYGNDKEQYINFIILTTEGCSISVDNDTLKRKEVTINGTQAYLFTDDKGGLIIWQVGDYTLQLATALSEAEIMKVARNVRIEK